MPRSTGTRWPPAAAAIDLPLPHPGEAITLPDDVVEALAGIEIDANVVHIDAYGTWMSGFSAVTDERGRLVAIVEADVPVDIDVRAGAVPADVGETLASILRQAAARMTRIEAAANTDGLTGLYNHRYFKERLEQELARARSHTEPLSLLFCDLDHFKQYNDAAGHQAGDEALQRLAGIFEDEFRRIDIAARYGGEEFAVVLPDTDRTGAADVAERVRRAVEAEHFGSDAEIDLTVSIGVAVFPEDARASAELIDKADWAMYRAKRRGRNRVELYGTEPEGDESESDDRVAADE